MNNYDITSLKTRQDKMESRISKIMEHFIPFRRSLIDGLEGFASEALAMGIKSVKKLHRASNQHELIEATITLNNFDLVILSNDEAYPLGEEIRSLSDVSRRGLLAAKIFFYLAGSEDNAPFTEVYVQEGPSDMYIYRVLWSTTDGPEVIAAGNLVSEEEGQKTAMALINHFYSFESAWKHAPTSRMVRARVGGTKQPIGFMQSKSQ